MNKIPDDVYEKALEIASYFFQPHSAKHTDIILKVCRVIMADREGRWQPIETAPKDGTPILAADDGPFAYVVEWFAAAKA